MQVTIATVRNRAPGRDPNRRRVWAWADGVIETQPEGDRSALETIRAAGRRFDAADTLQDQMQALDGQTVGYLTITPPPVDLPEPDRRPLE